MDLNFKTLWIAMAMIAITLTGCSKDDSNNEDEPSNTDTEWLYKIKTGKIVYLQTHWSSTGKESVNLTLIFDEYGKRLRMEMEDAVYIFDEVAKKSYYLFPADKEYSEIPYESTDSYRASFIFLGDDANSVWKSYTGFSKKSNKTVAGKTCSVYSWSENVGETIEWGGWNRITFWLQSYNGSPETNGSDRFEATSFSETIPANSFTVPSDYKKI